jgi:hypothetical protein
MPSDRQYVNLTNDRLRSYADIATSDVCLPTKADITETWRAKQSDFASFVQGGFPTVLNSANLLFNVEIFGLRALSSYTKGRPHA